MEKSLKCVEENKDLMLKTLQELISYPSVVTEGSANAPFGEAVHKCFLRMLEIAKEDGFEVKNVDNYGGHIDFVGETDEIVAVVGHLDVVPEGDLSNWTKKPYESVIEDGKLYGRGAVDDKGPLIAGYYAMKALKDSGYKPKKTIRVILGLDEETDWIGMDYYMKKENPNVVAGFSPDSFFPAIHGEKGLITFKLKWDLNKEEGTKAPKLMELKGGTVSNAVPDKAKAKIYLGENCQEILQNIKSYISKHEYEIVLEEGEDKTVEITANGVSAHAAYPESGLNAIAILFDLLGNISFSNESLRGAIEFFNTHIGFDYNGQRIGMKLEDEPSGKLTFNVGIVDYTEDAMVFTINVRYPVTFELEDVYNGIADVINPFDIKLERLDYQGPLYKPKDDPLIVTLMETYKKYTGDENAQAITSGGATYARTVPNTVAFGPIMPGEVDMCHQADEYINVETLMTSAKIFTECLYKLAK